MRNGQRHFGELVRSMSGMTMKEHFLRSSKIVNRYILLVALVGLFNVSFYSGAAAYISMAVRILGFFMIIVVNGNIVQIVEGKEQKAALRIVGENWKNYLVALLVIGVPVLIFRYLIKLAPLSGDQIILLIEAMRASMWVITIYVMPIVFLRRLGLIAVVAGIAYFFNHINQSMQIAVFVAGIFVLNTGGYLWVAEQAKHALGMVHVMPVLAILNILSAYLSFIAFAAATHVLVRDRSNSPIGEVNA